MHKVFISTIHEVKENIINYPLDSEEKYGGAFDLSFAVWCLIDVDFSTTVNEGSGIDIFSTRWF